MKYIFPPIEDWKIGDSTEIPLIVRILWTDLTCWHWMIGGIVWALILILTPQFVVLAAVGGVCRFDPNLRRTTFVVVEY